MSRVNDRAYYQARAKAERLLAAAATDSAIAGLHVQLAEEYERRVRSNTARPAEEDGEQPASNGFETVQATIHRSE